eukprot:scaffold51019_cov14-Tisochrysis_lutea.AAC.2
MQIGEGATLRGNNGFERQDVMRDFQQRIAERAGKLPKAPDSPPVRWVPLAESKASEKKRARQPKRP